MAFGRRASAAPAADAPPAAASTVEPGVEPTGKGRPTPKRADARKARRNPALKGGKATTSQRRDQLRADRRRAREALVTGDERYLPARDAGPERRLARDVIDSRFTYGQVFVIVVVGFFFLGTFIPSSTVQAITSYAGLLSLALIVVDSARHGRAASRAVADRFGANRAAGITSYAFMRAMLPRRFRRPPPKVSRGDAV